MLTEDDIIQSTPRDSKKKDSYEYARQMVYVLKTVWQRVSFSWTDWEKETNEAKHNKIWKRLGYPTFDDLLRAEIGVTKEQVIERKQAAATARKDGEPIVAKGGQPTHNNVMSRKQGNSSAYLLRRLARMDKADGTDWIDRYEDGEYKSARAAGIAAGIVKVKTPLEQLKAWWTKADAKQQRLFRKWIDEGNHDGRRLDQDA